MSSNVDDDDPFKLSFVLLRERERRYKFSLRSIWYVSFDMYSKVTDSREFESWTWMQKNGYRIWKVKCNDSSHRLEGWHVLEYKYKWYSSTRSPDVDTMAIIIIIVDMERNIWYE